MKISLSLALLVLPAMLMAQQNYTVKGHLGKIGPSAKIYLSYRDFDTDKLDSANLVDGTYQFKGQVRDVTFAELIINYQHSGLTKKYRTDSSNTYNFYLASGITDISSKDTLSNAKISGSEINEAGLLYDSLTTNVLERKHAVISQFLNSDRSPATRAAYNNSILALNNEIDSISFAFIRKRPSNYMSLIILSRVAGFSPDPVKIQPVYYALSPALRNTTAGKKLEGLLTSVTSTNIGNTAPDFIMNDQNGKKVKLADFRGKYVLLDFWASWCGPCRQENPNLVKTYTQYKDKNFTVLGVSLDSKKENWLKAIQNDQLTWTQVSDLKYWNNDAAVKYGINAVPANFLIDPQGKIIAKNLIGSSLEDKLKEVLK